jgi:hypothetical protein
VDWPRLLTRYARKVNRLFIDLDALAEVDDPTDAIQALDRITTRKLLSKLFMIYLSLCNR